MKKDKHKEPRPALTLFVVGLICLGAGFALSYVMEQQAPIGASVDQADLALAGGIVLCGISWIVAWAKARS